MDSSCMQVLFATVNGYLTLLHSLGKTLLLDIAANEDYRALLQTGRGLLVAAVYRRTDALQNLWLPASGSRSGSLRGRFAGGYLSELPAKVLRMLFSSALNHTLLRGDFLRWTAFGILTNT